MALEERVYLKWYCLKILCVVDEEDMMVIACLVHLLYDVEYLVRMVDGSFSST